MKEHRGQAAKAALASGFSPRMMEYFPAAGHQPTLPACLEKVDEAEVVVVLVAHRYGWAPDDPANSDAKSITWLECEHAWKETRLENTTDSAGRSNATKRSWGSSRSN